MRGIFGSFDTDKAKKKVSELIKEQMMKNGGKLNMKAVMEAQQEQPDYDDVMKERIEAHRQKLMEEAGEGMSESAKAAIQEMATIRAKKEAKKKKMLAAFHDDDKPKKGGKKQPLHFLAGSMGGGVGADTDYDWQEEKRRQREEDDRRRRKEDERRRRAEDDRRRREKGGW